MEAHNEHFPAYLIKDYNGQISPLAWIALPMTKQNTVKKNLEECGLGSNP